MNKNISNFRIEVQLCGFEPFFSSFYALGFILYLEIKLTPSCIRFSSLHSELTTDLLIKLVNPGKDHFKCLTAMVLRLFHK